MCVFADGVAGIKRFVLDSIVGAGGSPARPGSSGSESEARHYAHLAKEAIARPVGTRNPTRSSPSSRTSWKS